MTGYGEWVEERSSPDERPPEQQALKFALQALKDLNIVMGGFIGRSPSEASYAHAINLAAHVTSSLSAGDHHRRFAEDEGLPREDRSSLDGAGASHGKEPRGGGSRKEPSDAR